MSSLRVKLSRSDLSGSELSGSELPRSKLSRSKLSGSELSGSKFDVNPSVDNELLISSFIRALKILYTTVNSDYTG